VGATSHRGIVSCQHFSLLRDFEAPSHNSMQSLETTMECVLGASLGYISASNDYLGFGATALVGLPQSYHIGDRSAEDW